jgi:hypothetical protein
VKDVVVPIVVALLAGLSGGGLVPLVQVIRGRARARVDAVDVISDTAREWVVEFKAEATAARAETQAARAETAAARTETAAARTETEALRSEVRRLSQEATALADELHRIRFTILAPDATIDGLRDLVRRGAGPTTNGRP